MAVVTPATGWKPSCILIKFNHHTLKLFYGYLDRVHDGSALDDVIVILGSNVANGKQTGPGTARALEKKKKSNGASVRMEQVEDFGIPKRRSRMPFDGTGIGSAEDEDPNDMQFLPIGALSGRLHHWLPSCMGFWVGFPLSAIADTC
ncbi:uncharacterized protein K452DRAFT_302054 [Aplosporella prunicola CBS 121167]|uniref:Uncharacterized protein n=1 Tax=Aplosporella prunicola CBS 121167 TaxID=1176127 RepID=A0A6A6AZC5_9PEZI|nr:uncharacterized protein K452DRAFT_302054 [Aplosporella prunicola CBS 121167]KAF2137292.1 hypothetical protein K452DRAFT_302054 [Aplosporella prunicola CBS 121167]